MAEFRFALRQTVPVLCGYLFLGLAFGLLLQQAGYAWPWALLISGIVYAGSMQFVLVGMLGGGFASLLSVALTTLSVNSRHLFYGLSFLDTFKQMGRAEPYMIFSLTDETYSLLCGVEIPKTLKANRVRLWMSALDHGYWIIGSVAGAALGSVLPFDLTGIDFAMTALFVVIFLDQWRAAKSHLPAGIGLVFALIWLVILGPDRFLLPALVCTVLALTACRGKLEPSAMAAGAEPSAETDAAGQEEVR
ncbi:AzlC family ABC transporter permease [uncultured Gemmiger sp.]|uniref:AzlC family ABC transporter permease n=1 Tax=uncultured Gemmiger sp. TaxID=1623490 RepID=UPI0025EF14D9|nr:AzlC family ABC transporter permease [uncultured Gemmiger sp.]